MALKSDRTFVERDSLREVTYTSSGTPKNFDYSVTITGVWEAEQDSVVMLTQTNPAGFLFGVARKMSLTLTYLSSQDSTFTMVYQKK